MGHGYVCRMAVGTTGEWLKLVPFLLGNEQLILKGGGGKGGCLILQIDAVQCT